MPDIARMGAHPPAAAAVGYNVHTLGPQGFSDTTKWRNFDYFGWTPSGVTFNADGSVTLHNNNKTGTQTGNAGLATAWTTGGVTPLFSLGNAYGGGAYFEAVMRWTPEYAGAAPSGWPAFWSLPIEQNNSLPPYSIHWPGQAGTDGNANSYNHSIEMDFVEYLYGIKGRYGASMHDYSGLQASRVTVNGATGTPFIVPGGNDLTQFHKYGFLWVPATNAPSNGYSQSYFDDVAIGSKCEWVLNQDASGGVPPVVNYPTAGTQAGSIADKLHHFIILGNSSKDASGMQMIVREVNVWQVSDANNIHL